ncbi:MAG: ubiquinone biosynthesis protein [Alphaproteobacteria bacterium]|nr:ubiquinone biosynthesis protein [Alphaproteobacteria bacterium]
MALADTLDPRAAVADSSDGRPRAAPEGWGVTPRRQWFKALAALRRLLSDKEDTGQVFEIMRALSGDSTPRGYRRLLATNEGGRLAYERLELAPRLMDDAWLDSFAAGTVGAAYRDFVRRENLSAEGLAEVSRQNAVQAEQPHPYAWYGRRIRDAHDLWHVLTGYGRDGLGEACLVAFSYAQTRSLGWALIALGAALRARREGLKSAAKIIWEGYRRGQAAAWLPGEDYERLMAEPLEAARRRLRLSPPPLYLAVPAELRAV